MSIGPKPQEETSTRSFDSVKYTLVNTSKVFFKKPVYYLFNIVLLGIILSLFLERDVSWQLYLILLALGFASLPEKSNGK